MFNHNFDDAYLANTWESYGLFSGWSLFNYFMWRLVPGGNLCKSTIHAGVAVLFAIYGKNIPTVAMSSFSIGYYMDDLRYTNKSLYIIHHIFSIYQCWCFSFYPYTKYSLLDKTLLVECSIPLLNLFLFMNKNNVIGKRLILLTYLIVHIYYRNYMVINIYNDYVPKLIRDGMPWYQKYLFQLFIVMNYYWTYTTFKKLISN